MLPSIIGARACLTGRQVAPPALIIKTALIGLAILWTLGTAGCIPKRTSPSAPTVPAEQRQLFNEGMKAYQDQDYPEAIRRFQTVIERYPGSPLLQEAQWMIGKSYEAGGKHQNALSVYQVFQRNFPSSSHQYEATLRIEFLRGLLNERTAQRSRPRRIGMRFAGNPEEWTGRWEERIGRMTLSGINTVMVQGYGPNGVYFKTDQAPVVNERLSEWAGRIHARGLKVWVRIPSRHLPWFKAPGEERDWRYDPAKGRNVPTSALDLRHPGVLERLKRFYLDLAAAGIDGIVIDEDPWIEPWEGTSPLAQQAFQEDFGMPFDIRRMADGSSARAGGDPSFESSATPLLWRWIGWKNRTLLSRFAEVMAAVRDRYPAVDWIRIIPPAAVVEPHRAVARSGIDLLEEKQRGVDYFAMPLSFRVAQDNPFEVLSKLVDRVGPPERVVLLVPPAEDPWLASHGSDLGSVGIIMTSD